MNELPEISRQLERFVARRLVEFDQAAWKELTIQKRKECIQAARRALKAERNFFARQTPAAAPAPAE
ncbi:hypothetical protein [Ancylobacter mangrovi]|uniref:Uncharacterized protein n=1 Tax=Ancylobacter mangrovi TaxID=2972472 RepID=A0A9X2PHD8_9HYPH|nr:hypothetical protein [Ancylobacter mangrovi]MCS0494518.1 hypothetical protein [Ancylobacter mangrovi]MCS0500776.1 hypothetical protein [Ancylobacter mangrovi]